MTPKQEERLRNKIARIRKELAEDKKRWGGFHHDGRGVRYLPPELFIKLRDYKGGLRYLRWFGRAFPDDAGFPIFLFEWTLILFKTGNLKEAESKAFETFFANYYLFDKFLEKKLAIIEHEVLSNVESKVMTEYLQYSKITPEYEDFAVWLENFLSKEEFCNFANELMEIDRKLVNESPGKKRSELVRRRHKLRQSKEFKK